MKDNIAINNLIIAISAIILIIVSLLLNLEALTVIFGVFALIIMVLNNFVSTCYMCNDLTFNKSERQIYHHFQMCSQECCDNFYAYHEIEEEEETHLFI